ncbi:hypothetical protein ON021_28190, partial [Microcoleus sp. HI-ES]|nr:hypothetical protein [Microcoleus sp. HI-ES]
KSTILKNRQDACSTKSEFSCGTGILPVPKQIIENCATSQFKDTYIETWLMARYCVSDPSVRLILTELALTHRSIGYKYK